MVFQDNSKRAQLEASKIPSECPVQEATEKSSEDQVHQWACPDPRLNLARAWAVLIPNMNS